MSVAFAKQSELSRIARQKKEETQAQIVHQQGMHSEMKRERRIEEVDGPLKKETKKCKHEELKSLCKELSEESGEVGLLREQLHSNTKSDYVLGQTTHESVTAEGLFSHVQGHMAEETLVSLKKDR